jgi:hypothetical protein
VFRCWLRPAALPVAGNELGLTLRLVRVHLLEETGSTAFR